MIRDRPATARRLLEFLEPSCRVSSLAGEPFAELAALGHRTVSRSRRGDAAASPPCSPPVSVARKPTSCPRSPWGSARRSRPGAFHHLPARRLAAVRDGLRERGLVDADARIESVTDELAAPPWDALTSAELDEL